MIDKRSWMIVILLWVAVAAFTLLPPLSSAVDGIIKDDEMRSIYFSSAIALLGPLIFCLYRRRHMKTPLILLSGAVGGYVIGCIAAALSALLARGGLSNTVRAGEVFGWESTLLSYSWVGVVTCSWLVGAIAALAVKAVYFRDNNKLRRVRQGSSPPSGSV